MLSSCGGDPVWVMVCEFPAENSMERGTEDREGFLIQRGFVDEG